MPISKASQIEQLPRSKKIEGKAFFEDLHTDVHYAVKNDLCLSVNSANPKVVNTNCGHWYRIITPTTKELVEDLFSVFIYKYQKNSTTETIARRVDPHGSITWFLHVESTLPRWPPQDSHGQTVMFLDGSFISVDDWTKFYKAIGFPYLDLDLSKCMQIQQGDELHTFIETKDLYAQLSTMIENHTPKSTDNLPYEVIQKAQKLAYWYMYSATGFGNDIREALVKTWRKESNEDSEIAL